MSKALFFTSFFLILLGGCASSAESPSSVLEPVAEENNAPPSVLEEAQPTPPPAPKPADRLLEQLRALGYEGTGMEFEDPSTLEFLEKIFASPEAKNLDVKNVYTGMRMEYDKVQKSLTLGGTRDLRSVRSFLKKKVAKRPPPN